MQRMSPIAGRPWLEHCRCNWCKREQYGQLVTAVRQGHMKQELGLFHLQLLLEMSFKILVLRCSMLGPVSVLHL